MASYTRANVSNSRWLAVASLATTSVDALGPAVQSAKFLFCVLCCFVLGAKPVVGLGIRFNIGQERTLFLTCSITGQASDGKGAGSNIELAVFLRCSPQKPVVDLCGHANEEWGGQKFANLERTTAHVSSQELRGEPH